MREVLRRYRLPPVWAVVCTVIFLAILILGYSMPGSPWTTFVRLGGVLACFLYSILRFPRDHLLHLAMLFTCLADFILAKYAGSVTGVCLFILVQLVHLVRLHGAKYRTFALSFIFVAATSLCVNRLVHLAPQLVLAACLYAVLSIMNITLSYRWQATDRSNSRARQAFFGFLVLFFCDLGTVISYFSLPKVALLPGFFYRPANFMVWLFYYPSQILLSNTGKYDKIGTKGR